MTYYARTIAILLLFSASLPVSARMACPKLGGILSRTRLDPAAIESKKRGYLHDLTRLLKETPHGEAPPFEPPRSTEEKIALIEAFVDLYSTRADSAHTFARLKEKEPRKFVKTIKKWRPDNPLQGRRIERLMEQDYRAARSNFFRLRSNGSVFSTHEDLAAMSLLRWKYLVASADVRSALEKAKIASYKEGLDLKPTLGGLFNLYLNVHTFYMFNVPFFFPRSLSFYGTKKNREAQRAIVAAIEEVGTQAAYERFRRHFLKIDRFESYKDWAQKIYPFFVVGFIVGQATTIQFIAIREFERSGIPDLRSTKTRPDIEEEALQMMEEIYRNSRYSEPSPEQREAFRRVLESMGIVELGSIRRRTLAGDERPLADLVEIALAED